MMELNDCVARAEEVSALEYAWRILTASKQRNFVAVQISPAVRVSIGEKFGLARGEDGVGKVVAALQLLGADVVVDTAIAADALTLIKLKQALANKEAGKGTVYSSECSAWVSYAKEKYPEIELLPTATTVCAKLLKKYYGEQMPGKKIRVIALEMGEAKKADPGVDLVLTLDELGILINSLETNVRLLKKQPLETPLGIGSGASYIAAASGGDAEALARCLTTEKTQLNYRKFEYSGLYGKCDRREAILTLDGVEWKFAVVDSLEAADAVIAEAQAGAQYDYVEVMASAGGQIGVGCDLATEEGEMTRRLRKLGLKYLDQKREARSAEVSASAALLLKNWEKLCRSGEADAYDVIDEIVEDFDEIEEPVVEEVIEEAPVEEVVEEPVVEEVIEEAPVEEEVIEEAPAEEVAEEPVVEEVIEEAPVEEVAEEIPFEEVTEEDILEEQIEEALEVFEEAVQEELGEAESEEPEVVEEIAVTEKEEQVEDAIEEVVEEPIVEEAIEETPVEEVAEEPVVEEAIEEAPVEEVAEEAEEEEETLTAEKEAELMQQVSKEELEAEMKRVMELIHVEEKDLTIAQKLARAHYYRRLSTKERRKLKRMRKKAKNNKK